MTSFKKTTLRSFYGDVLYRQIMRKGHFLLDLGEVMDWDSLTPVLLEAYKGRAEKGESPYHPVMLFKMLMLTYIWGISERRAEDLCNYYIPAKAFVGLGMYDEAPDHSTLTVFKKRLVAHAGLGDYEKIFDSIIRQAMAKGVCLGSIQLVDSVHTEANVDTERDRERHEQGKPSSDPDAAVVHKGRRQVTNANGITEQQQVMYLGYKTHVSMEAVTGMVTSIKPTVGNSADNKQLPDLVAHDQSLGVPGETYAADKGYDDGDLHVWLESLQKHSALCLTRQRTEKKDTNKAKWLAQLADPYYQAGCKVRYRIERTFGELKLWHRFGRCRYKGLIRYKIQAFLTFMALNLKRMVFLTTGGRPHAMPTR